MEDVAISDVQECVYDRTVSLCNPYGIRYRKVCDMSFNTDIPDMDGYISMEGKYRAGYILGGTVKIQTIHRFVPIFMPAYPYSYVWQVDGTDVSIVSGGGLANDFIVVESNTDYDVSFEVSVLIEDKYGEYVFDRIFTHERYHIGGKITYNLVHNGDNVIHNGINTVYTA